MKLVKMSLAAAVLLGTSAFAIDNVKVSGDAKLLYTTSSEDYEKKLADGSGSGKYTSGLFDQGSSAADVAVHIGATGDLTKGISFGVAGYAVSTLGLENNLVSNTWTGAHGVGGDTTGVNDTSWVSEAWIAATVGKTTAKIGRMELDTPLAFSEKWSIAANTFDAAVLLNQDLPDTTLVGAWVGKGNGVNALGNTFSDTAHLLDGHYGITANTDLSLGAMNGTAVGIDGIVGTSANFNTFANSGAYAVAVVNNSFKPLTAQAWYYNVANIADAYWLQGDINCQMVKGLTIGAQYVDMSPKGALDKDLGLLDTTFGTKLNDDTTAYAFKLGYNAIPNLKLAAAYSSVSNTGALKVANVGTDNLNAAQSKLYTEAFWNYGYVGAVGSDSYMLSAEYDAGVAKLAAQYTSSSVKEKSVNQAALFGDTKAIDMNEIALSVSKSFGPLDTTLAYISTDADNQNAKAGKNPDYDGRRYDIIQAYLTLNF